MKQKTKLIIKIYIIILIIAFFIGPHLGLVKTELVYNITCDNGTTQIFNEETLIVCGKENPFKEQIRYEIERDPFYIPINPLA